MKLGVIAGHSARRKSFLKSLSYQPAVEGQEIGHRAICFFDGVHQNACNSGLYNFRDRSSVEGENWQLIAASDFGRAFCPR